MTDCIKPIPMILHCPNCGKQHIDEVDEVTNPGWENPPHTSHLCLGCGTIWRPCQQPTEGVKALEFHGKSDTWPAVGRVSAAVIEQKQWLAEFRALKRD